MNDIYLAVSVLIDCGWTSDDKYDLMYAYDLSEEEAERICSIMKVYEGTKE